MAEPPESPKTRMKSTSLIQSKALTNLIPKSDDYNASSVQSPNCLQHLITVSTDNHSILNPPTPIPGDWVGDGNRIGFIRRQSMLKTKSRAKATSFGSQLRIKSYRNEVDGVEDALQSNSSADSHLYNKKMKCSSNGSFKEYVMLQNLINQQRAYFKEIDDYELQVEEVEEME